jgi:hypothetical protein
MGVIIINSYVLGNPPLALSISDPSTVNPIEITGSPSTTATTSAGLIISNATPTGGDGSYSYSWALSEVMDMGNNFSVHSQGAATASQTFDTSRITGTTPASPLDPPNSAVYRIACTVTDGTGATISAQVDFPVDAFAL